MDSVGENQQRQKRARDKDYSNERDQKKKKGTDKEHSDSKAKEELKEQLPACAKERTDVLQSSKTKIPLDFLKEIEQTISTTPSILTCRESQRTQLTEVIKSAVEKETGKVIFVFGSPGTGKTALLTEILLHLQKSLKFHNIFINGMEVANATELLKLLGNKLLSQHESKDLLAKLASYFANKKHQMCVLVVDEIDALAENKAIQKILKHIFSWTKSRLIAIGISNTKDSEKVAPVIAPSNDFIKIPFSCYTAKEIEAIVAQRIKSLDQEVILPNALAFLGRYTENSASGDIRFALNAFKKAILSQISPTEGEEKKFCPINLPTIASIVSQGQLNDKLSTLNFNQKVILTAALRLFKSNSDMKVPITYAKLQKEFKTVAETLHLDALSTDTFKELFDNMTGVLSFNKRPGKSLASERIKLEVSEDDAIIALGSDHSLLAHTLPQALF